MKNKFVSTDLLILILAVVAIAFGVTLVYVNPNTAGVVCLALLIIMAIIFFNARTARKFVKSIFYGSGKHSNLQQLSFEKLNVPVAIINKDTIVWYNETFKQKLLGGNDSYLVQLEKVLPDFDVERSCENEGLDIVVEGREYTVHSSIPTEDTKLWVSYFEMIQSIKLTRGNTACPVL